MQQFAQLFKRGDIARGFSQNVLGKTVHDTLAFSEYAGRFVNLLGLRGSEGNCADVGCGPGHIGIAVSNEMDGGKMFLLDLSSQMVELTEENIQAGGWNNNVRHETLVADGQDIREALGGIELDAVFSRHVVQFMQEPHLFFSGAYNLLKPFGKMAFSLIGFSTFNFSDNNLSNSLLQNQFHARLLWAALQELPDILSQLPSSAINDLIYQGILVKEYNGIFVSPKAILPKMDKISMFAELRKAGIPQSAITYLVMGEIHTVGFKRSFSERVGSIPIPGIWNIFDRMDYASRVLAVKRIYERAFGRDLNRPIYTEDPLFVITKEAPGFGSFVDMEQMEFAPIGLVRPESTEVVEGVSQIRIVKESFDQSSEQIAALALQYGYDAWRVRGFDIQHASAHLVNPPKEFLPMNFATLIMQGNRYTFTSSEKPSLADQEARIVTPYSIVLDKGEGLPREGQLFYEGRPLSDFEKFRLIEIMFEPSPWYFAFKDTQGNPVPKYLIVNPY